MGFSDVKNVIDVTFQKGKRFLLFSKALSFIS